MCRACRAAVAKLTGLWSALWGIPVYSVSSLWDWWTCLWCLCYNSNGIATLSPLFNCPPRSIFNYQVGVKMAWNTFKSLFKLMANLWAVTKDFRTTTGHSDWTGLRQVTVTEPDYDRSQWLNRTTTGHSDWTGLWQVTVTEPDYDRSQWLNPTESNAKHYVYPFCNSNILHAVKEIKRCRVVFNGSYVKTVCGCDVQSDHNRVCNM